MPNITYFTRFTLREPKPGIPYEEHEHTSLAGAFEALRLFAEPDSRWMYTQIELTEYNWNTGTDTAIATLTFTA